jgi:NAD(P)-dependent dehydrogenase (short-subunit alcohol dehydrogenase family)
MLTSIAGRSAIVTGASKGIGKGIARVLASKGAHVLVVARSQEGAETTAAETPPLPPLAIFRRSSRIVIHLRQHPATRICGTHSAA